MDSDSSLQNWGSIWGYQNAYRMKASLFMKWHIMTIQFLKGGFSKSLPWNICLTGISLSILGTSWAQLKILLASAIFYTSDHRVTTSTPVLSSFLQVLMLYIHKGRGCGEDLPGTWTCRVCVGREGKLSVGSLWKEPVGNSCPLFLWVDTFHPAFWATQ